MRTKIQRIVNLYAPGSLCAILVACQFVSHLKRPVKVQADARLILQSKDPNSLQAAVKIHGLASEDDFGGSLSSMIFGSRGHFFRSRILRIFLLVVFAWSFLEALYIHRNLIAAESRKSGRANTEKIFICALPWNNEIILRTHLINQIRDLVHALGNDNVYISIFENGSFDGTKPALRDLQRELEELGVRNKMILDDVSHQDIVNQRPREPQPGWIQVEDPGFEKFQIHQGDYALRRIHYLATLRNKALEPLVELAERGETFDKVRISMSPWHLKRRNGFRKLYVRFISHR